MATIPSLHRLLLFLEIDPNLANRITRSNVEAAAQVATVDELRQLAGLQPVGPQRGGDMFLGRPTRVDELLSRETNRLITNRLASVSEQLERRNGKARVR